MEAAFEARRMARMCRSGALATQARDTGTPYVSFCATAFDGIGQPVFLFSDLADHTRNIQACEQVSFLCERASSLSNPQAGPRVTLVGRMERTIQPDLCSLFLQMHPSAKMYASFNDFNFYRLHIEKAHYVGGFGRAIWMDAGQYLGDSAAFLSFLKKQEEMVQLLNRDFPTFAAICATKLLKLRGKNWQVLRVDTDGIDLKLASKVVRYPFEKEVKTSKELLQWVREICS